MKARQESALFTTPFGSRLYGTNGPTSDLDYKVVCLPSIDTLLMNIKVTNRKVTPEGLRPGDKMIAGEAEYEYIPMQVFLGDFFNGQTYAIEIAFAVLQDKFSVNDENYPAEQNYIKEWMQRLVDMFLTRNVSKMVGYAVSQSRNYGLKTERYSALKDVQSEIEKYFEFHKELSVSTETPNSTEILRLKLLSLPFVEEVMIENAQGGSALAPAFDICGKKFPYTTKWNTIVSSINKSIDQYGDRVKKYDGEGIDWKALSHAIRITEQVIELSASGKFSFPRPNAEYLKSVKEGKVPLDDALQYLTDCFNQVDDIVAKSVLKERTPELEAKFENFKISILREYYF